MTRCRLTDKCQIRLASIALSVPNARRHVVLVGMGLSVRESQLRYKRKSQCVVVKQSRERVRPLRSERKAVSGDASLAVALAVNAQRFSRRRLCRSHQRDS